MKQSRKHLRCLVKHANCSSSSLLESDSVSFEGHILNLLSFSSRDPVDGGARLRTTLVSINQVFNYICKCSHIGVLRDRLEIYVLLSFTSFKEIVSIDSFENNLFQVCLSGFEPLLLREAYPIFQKVRSGNICIENFPFIFSNYYNSFVDFV